MRHHADQRAGRRRAGPRRRTTVFGSCISDEDPLLHARAARRRDRDERHAALAAPSQARENFSPTTLPIEPPMNAKSMTASSHGMPVDRRLADHHRLAEAGLQLRLREPLGVRPQVEEVERILRAELGRLLDERPRVGELRDARRARASGSGGRSAGRPRAPPRARRPGSASRTAGTCSGAAFPAAPGRSRCSIETSIRSAIGLRV